MLFQKIALVVEWFGKLWVAIFEALWDVVRDAACWPFEQVLEITATAIEAVDLSGIQGYTASWGNLPGEITNILGLLGVGTCAGIIVAAIGIRLVLQLVPFTRVGS